LHGGAAVVGERRPKDFAVFCSCAPGQVSWGSDRDHHSVFGYFVAKGLSGEASQSGGSRVKVQELVTYVQGHVADWTWANRRAIQTPILLGDRTLDFYLPR